ncbi:hypothetical protein Aperf_G00000058650 [Anoplocephala perfoliata]
MPITRSSGRLSSTRSNVSSNSELETMLQMLRRGLLLALESMDATVFKMKINWILENCGDYADLVFMSGLDSDGKTALHIAVENRFEEAVKSLLSTGKVDLLATAGEGGWSALHTAVDLGDANLTQALLPTSQNANLHLLAALKQPTASPCAVTALHMAVRRNSTSCAVVLLQTANILVRGHSGGRTTSEDEDDTFIAEKVQQCRDFHGQAEDGSRKLNKLKDANGDTPLHWAVKTNNYTMARLLCSYGAHPRRFHNNQGQTPLALAKYVIRNPKMTKLLVSFLPTFSRADSTTTGEKETISEDGVEIQNSSDDPIVSMELLHEATLRRGVKASVVDGTCPRLQKTSFGVQMIHPNPVGGVETAEKRPKSCQITSGGSISGRPYLHREVKAACTLDLRFDSDSLGLSRMRSNSLKVGRRELETLRSPLPQSPLERAVLHRPHLIPPKNRRRASLVDPAEYYPMASPQRGICIVINNMSYWHPNFQNRGGCDKDEKRVEQVFGDLGFLVKVFRNLSSGEMQSELAYIGRKTDHSSYDAFVAVIMAHGGLGELYGVNGDAFPVHQLTLNFTTEKCPSLAGKPKLFFIQACRGDEYQMGYALPVNGTNEEAPATKQEKTSPNPLYIRPQRLESNDPKTIEEMPAIAAAKLLKKQRLVPSFADFLLSYATLTGFKAQRDPRNGSAYIQTLCQHLEMYGRSRSLLDIVTSVHREVSEKVFREAESTEQGEGIIFQQTPEVRHTLTRRVQFV